LLIAKALALTENIKLGTGETLLGMHEPGTIWRTGWRRWIIWRAGGSSGASGWAASRPT
jgi:hypothetical protein